VRSVISLSDAAVFRPAARRTRVVRAGLAAALLVTLAVAFLLARTSPSRAASSSGGPSTVVVLDLSWSTSSNFRQIAGTLRGLASSGGRVGLVVFSDAAYEMLPTGTPSVELRPLLRFFGGPRSRRAESPWALSLSGGTRISAGLQLALDMLRRDRVTSGSVVLVSDLDDAPNDRAQLAAAVLSYLRAGVPLRAVAINPTAENERFFRGLLESRPLRAGVTGSAPVDGAPSSSGLPVALVAVAALLLALLAVNEHACARLTWRSESG
jgi:hypothetical protein